MTAGLDPGIDGNPPVQFAATDQSLLALPFQYEDASAEVHRAIENSKADCLAMRLRVMSVFRRFIMLINLTVFLTVLLLGERNINCRFRPED